MVSDNDRDHTVSFEYQGAEVNETQPGPTKVTLRTSAGDIHCLYHPVPVNTKGVLWVGGVGGGFDGPAGAMYRVLADELVAAGIASLRLDYRHPHSLEDCILDVLAGIYFLDTEDVTELGLVGHSSGGAVVIQAALPSPTVVAVVTLATQSYGTAGVEQLAPRPILIIHGTADHVLRPSASEDVFHRAQQPKELVLIEGAGHSLEEARTEVQQLVRDWLTRNILSHTV